MILAGCAPEAPNPRPAEPFANPFDSFRSLDSPSLEFLPDEIGPLTLRAAPLVVSSEALDRYLGSDAKALRSLGIVDLAVGEYSVTRDGDPVTVEIHHFASDLGAFGAWTRSRGRVRMRLESAGRAHVGQRALHAWVSEWYVRVIPRTTLTPPDHETISVLGAVTDSLPGPSPLPALFTVFPTEGRVDDSESFNLGSGFGQPAFDPYLATSFESSDGRIDGLIFAAPSEEAAMRALDDYRTLYETNGRLLNEVESIGSTNFTGEDEYLGRTAAFADSNLVVAFRGFVPRKALVTLLEGAQTNLDEFRGRE